MLRLGATRVTEVGGWVRIRLGIANSSVTGELPRNPHDGPIRRATFEREPGLKPNDFLLDRGRAQHRGPIGRAVGCVDGESVRLGESNDLDGRTGIVWLGEPDRGGVQRPGRADQDAKASKTARGEISAVRRHGRDSTRVWFHPLPRGSGEPGSSEPGIIAGWIEPGANHPAGRRHKEPIDHGKSIVSRFFAPESFRTRATARVLSSLSSCSTPFRLSIVW